MGDERGPATDERLAAEAARSGRAWRRLGLRLRAIRPNVLARFLLVVAAVAAIAWLVRASWPALLPFAIGGVVAYLLLPVVNRLDAVLPRTLAALVAMGGATLLLVLLLTLVVPPLARELVGLYGALPSPEEVRQYLGRLDRAVDTLPGPVRAYVRGELAEIDTDFRQRLDRYLDRPLALLAAGVLRLVDSVGFVLGFLVLPTWLLAVVTDQRTAARALGRTLPGWLAGDLWAVLRILDRVFGAFVRGRLLLGLAVGLGVWTVLTLVDRFVGTTGVQYASYALALAVIAGVMQLVPVIGPIVTTVVFALIGLSINTRAAVLVPLVYIAVQWLAGRMVAPRLERRVVDLHPALLVMAIAALSQFGFLWLLLAAPLVAVARDLFRYTSGRLGDPPLPAGIVPWEAASYRNAAQASASRRAVSQRAPPAYRRQMRRSPETPGALPAPEEQPTR